MRVKDGFIAGIVEEDRAADFHAPAETFEIILHTFVTVVAVDEHEVDLAGLDFDRP